MKKKVIVKLFYAILEIVYNYIRRIKLYYDNLENKEREFITVQRNSFFFFCIYCNKELSTCLWFTQNPIISLSLFLSLFISLSFVLCFINTLTSVWSTTLA